MIFAEIIGIFIGGYFLVRWIYILIGKVVINADNSEVEDFTDNLFLRFESIGNDKKQKPIAKTYFINKKYKDWCREYNDNSISNSIGSLLKREEYISSNNNWTPFFSINLDSQDGEPESTTIYCTENTHNKLEGLCGEGTCRFLACRKSKPKEINRLKKNINDVFSKDEQKQIRKKNVTKKDNQKIKIIIFPILGIVIIVISIVGSRIIDEKIENKYREKMANECNLYLKNVAREAVQDEVCKKYEISEIKTDTKRIILENDSYYAAIIDLDCITDNKLSKDEKIELVTAMYDYIPERIDLPHGQLSFQNKYNKAFVNMEVNGNTVIPAADQTLTNK